MPTRVFLQELAPAVRRTAANNSTNPALSPRTPTASGSRPPKNTSSSRTPYSFRKTIRGEQIDEDGCSDEPSSDSDARSSPRMTCYINSLLCCCIMLISIVQFFFKEDDEATAYDEEEFYVSNYGVYLWKLRGAFGISSAGIAIYLVVILAHFDTLWKPDFWMSFFQDGSKGERNLIYALIAFWIGGVYLCTSVLSVGSVQPNVYFTSWIAFSLNVANYSTWRAGAGYRTWREMLKSYPRETSYNWSFTLFFALVVSFGASDMYANRNQLSIYFQGQEVHAKDRLTGMLLAWVSVIICIIVLLGNHFLTTVYSWTCCKCCEVTLDWRQFEGILLLAMLAMYGYVIFVYTGTLGVFNSPSNTYFGIWGTFFSAVVTLGTWIRENRNFFMVRILPSSPTTVSSTTRRRSFRRRSTSTA